MASHDELDEAQRLYDEAERRYDHFSRRVDDLTAEVARIRAALELAEAAEAAEAARPRQASTQELQVHPAALSREDLYRALFIITQIIVREDHPDVNCPELWEFAKEKLINTPLFSTEADILSAWDSAFRVPLFPLFGALSIEMIPPHFEIRFPFAP